MAIDPQVRSLEGDTAPQPMHDGALPRASTDPLEGHTSRSVDQLLTDLRTVRAITRVGLELERIGDHAKNIAEQVLQVVEGERPRNPRRYG